MGLELRLCKDKLPKRQGTGLFAYYLPLGDERFITCYEASRFPNSTCIRNCRRAVIVSDEKIAPTELSTLLR